MLIRGNTQVSGFREFHTIASRDKMKAVLLAIANVEICSPLLQLYRAVAPAAGIETKIGKYDEGVGRQANRAAILELCLGLPVARP